MATLGRILATTLVVVGPASTASTYHGLFLWLGLMVLLLLVGFGGYSYLKRWMRADDGEAGSARGGFSLSDLRDLHRQGKMSAEEYEATRANLVAAAKRQADAMPPVIPNRRPPAE